MAPHKGPGASAGVRRTGVSQAPADARTADVRPTVPRRPDPPRFVEGSGLSVNMVPPADATYFDFASGLVHDQPAEALDPENAGALAADTTDKGVEPRPNDGARKLDLRSWWWYLGVGISPAFTAPLPGGSQYVFSLADQEGRALDGGRNYRPVLPPDIPAARFWSVTAYDNQTRSMRATARRGVRRSTGGGRCSLPSPVPAAVGPIPDRSPPTISSGPGTGGTALPVACGVVRGRHAVRSARFRGADGRRGTRCPPPGRGGHLCDDAFTSPAGRSGRLRPVIRRRERDVATSGRGRPSRSSRCRRGRRRGGWPYRAPRR
ncbi:DUF1214 domain-containing protein [Streptomyces sp. PU_AKi4]|uniref:DUF1214 domain-containing protein n=1 Tax=Streptomyces sp. PU_AKi4 TaxID=2800809 RepID=UPI0035235D43